MAADFPFDADGDSHQRVATIIRLWDGNDYDRTFLAAEYPELLAYAQEHATLRETCPLASSSLARKSLTISLFAMNLFFGPIAIWGGWDQGGLPGALLGLALANCLVVPICIMFAWAEASGFRRRRPSVRVRGGHIWIYLGGRCAHIWRLAQVEWYRGSLSETTVLEKIALPRGPAIVLATEHPFYIHGDMTLAVGYTEHMRQIWRQFLTLSEMFRRTAWEPRPMSLVRLTTLAVGVASFPIIIACGALALKGFIELLRQVGINRDLAALAAYPLFPLTVLALYIHGTFWPWRGLKRISSSKSEEKLRKLRRRQFPMSCVPIVGMSLFLLLLGDRQIPVGDRILTMLVWAPILTLIAWVTTDRIGRLAWQKTLDDPSHGEKTATPTY